MTDFWTQDPRAYAELDRESRKFWLHPWLRGAIQQISPKRILDFGCGDGSLFHQFPLQLSELVLYDHSQPMIDMAKAHFGDSPKVSFHVSDADIPAEHFDLVVLSLVLMTIPTKAEQRRVAGRVFQFTERGGHCLLAITHPCFRQHRFSTFKTEYSEKPFYYFNEGAPFRVQISDAGREEFVEFTDYHWSLAFTINLLLESGFLLRRVVELPDKAALKEMESAQFPSYLVLQYQKP